MSNEPVVRIYAPIVYALARIDRACLDYLKWLFCATLTLLIGGCAVGLPPTGSTVSGCGLRVGGAESFRAKVKEAIWDGKCTDGLANGQGKLVLQYFAGGQSTYVGNMVDGRYEGVGEFTNADNWRWKGEFLIGALTRGQVYRPNGALVFDGYMAHDKNEPSGKHITYHDSRYGGGTLYFPDGGRIEEGEFEVIAGIYVGTGQINPNTGAGIIRGKYYKNNQFVHYIVAGKTYKNLNDYSKASIAHSEKEIERMKKESERSTQEYERQQMEFAAKQKKQKEQETREALGILYNAAAVGLKQGTVAQQVAASLRENGTSPPSQQTLQGPSYSGLSCVSPGSDIVNGKRISCIKNNCGRGISLNGHGPSGWSSGFSASNGCWSGFGGTDRVVACEENDEFDTNREVCVNSVRRAVGKPPSSPSNSSSRASNSSNSGGANVGCSADGSIHPAGYICPSTSDPCPRGKSLVNGQCRSGVAQ